MIKKNLFNVLGCLIGIAIIVMGVFFVQNPAESYYTESAKDVTFGGDYYTYQYQATKIAVGNTAVTANNIRELSKILSMYFGYAFIFAGALVIVSFAKNIELKKKQSEAYVAEENTDKDEIWQFASETEELSADENITESE